MEETQFQEPQRNRVARFFSHPVISVISIAGGIASIIGLPLAFILYFVSQEKRDLVYTISPVRTVLAQTRGETTDKLKILFLDEIITGTDVVAIQLTIWNQGKASIRPQNILSPIEIKITTKTDTDAINKPFAPRLRKPPISILEVSSNKISREAIDFKASNDREYLRQGRIPLTWKILEKNDGAILQIIYAGSLEANIDVTGLVEGQRSISYSKVYENRNSLYTYTYRIAIYILFPFSMIITLRVVIYKKKYKQSYDRLDISIICLSTISSISFILSIILNIMRNLDSPSWMIK